MISKYLSGRSAVRDDHMAYDVSIGILPVSTAIDQRKQGAIDAGIMIIGEKLSLS